MAMKRLRQNLLREQARYALLVRRVLLIALLLAACLVGALTWGRRLVAGPGGVPAELADQPEPAGPGAALAGEDHPSQLMSADWLAGTMEGSPVRRSGEGAERISLVDPDVLLVALQTVSEQSQEALVKRADPQVVWQDFADVRRRRELRGRVCRFQGTLRRWNENDQLDMTSVGLKHLYEGQIQDAAGHWYSFYCFEEPPRPIAESDEANLVGVFYGLIQYPTRGGKEMVTPLIVARTVTGRPVPAPTAPLLARVGSQMPAWACWAAAAAVVALICGGLSLLLRRRPGPAPARRRRGGSGRPPRTEEA
jgi:hypothetical protein